MKVTSYIYIMCCATFHRIIPDLWKIEAREKITKIRKSIFKLFKILEGQWELQNKWRNRLSSFVKWMDCG